MTQTEAQFLAPGIQQISTLSGLAIERGEGAVLQDVDGNRFLDWVAGIGVASIGHGHPRLAQALGSQAARITCTSFTSAARLSLVQRIVACAPDPSLNRVQLYSSGAEAVESALRLAKAVTGNSEVISFWGGFHGKTGGVLGLVGSPWKHGQLPFMPGQSLTPYAECARCPLRQEPSSCQLFCVDFLRDQVRFGTGHRVAAILVEPVQGTAGNVVPHPGFLRALKQVADEIGALLIVDEMITGFGRTGSLWASSWAGVVPDIVVFGKGVAAGFPLSGLLTRADLAAAKPWSEASHSSSSFGGNPLACAAADATTQVIIEENLAEHAAQVGAHLKMGLVALSKRYPVIAGVRGRGLMLGFDLVENGELWPKERCVRLFQACLEVGLLTQTYSPRVRINPPLVLTIPQVDGALMLLSLALDKTYCGGR